MVVVEAMAIAMRIMMMVMIVMIGALDILFSRFPIIPPIHGLHFLGDAVYSHTFEAKVVSENVV